MRKPARQNPAQQRVSHTKSIPACVGGWNGRDSIASMKPDDAIILDNCFPTASVVELRKGSATYATDIDSGDSDVLVETLIVYKPPSGDQEMFAIAGTEIFDVSAPGAVGAAVVSSLTNARWQYANITTSGGNFIEAVNGEDDLLLYNGTTWAPIDGASTPAITGVATDELVNICVHQKRVWFIQKDSLDAWYTAVDAITGALTKFPMGSVFRSGGYLMAQGTWTIDSGEGKDDLAVFITSEGEAAVYRGTDPASSSTWELVGVYTVGLPIGRRCMQKLGGDLLIITTDGVISASQYLVTGQTDKSVAMSDRIQTPMATAVGLYADNDGWEMTFFPGGSALLLNVPVIDGVQQFVMNTITKRWCRFKAWEASCFAVYDGFLYYGTLGAVVKAWTGTSDRGAEIDAEILQAFNYFRDRNHQKHFNLIRPILGWDVNPAVIRIGIDVDFQVKQPTSQINPPANNTVLIWDVGLWDVNVWGGDLSLNKDWYTVYGVGIAGALHMLISSDAATITYSACDFVYALGEVI